MNVARSIPPIFANIITCRAQQHQADQTDRERERERERERGLVRFSPFDMTTAIYLHNIYRKKTVP